MGDGAHIGVTPSRALETILGDADQPSDDETMTAQEMLAWVLAAPENPESYDDGCRYTAKLILNWLLADPTRAKQPSENVYETDIHGRLVFNDEGGLNLVVHGWYDRMKSEGIPIPEGLTGFMWGYAVNTALRCLELPPEPNPAIVEL